MQSKIFSSKDHELLIWLNTNSSKFLESGDKIESAFYLKNTIKNDPNASNLGITFDNKFEIQPKAIFVFIDAQGATSIGIIEISSNAVGLKDVGILHAYAKMIEPKYALLLCEKSYSKELAYLLTDPEIGPRLIGYAKSKNLKMLDFSSSLLPD